MIDEVSLHNSWWISEKVPEYLAGKITRSIYHQVLEDMKSKKITCLIGPRRVGKTTIMYDIIRYLLDNGVSNRNIMYASLDNSKIRFQLESGFDDLIKQFIVTVSEEELTDLKETKYIFLDEIHKLEDWGNKLKYWQDLGLKLKFVITGSSASRILKGSGETILGRVNFHAVSPLNFSEFCRVDGVRIDITNFKQIANANKRLLIHKQKYILELERFLLKGGYPEIFFEKDIEKAYQDLRIYKTLTISREIVDIKGIKDPRVLSDLFDLLTDFMSERVNYSHFAKILKIKVDTIKAYMSYFEEAFLIYPAYQFSKRQVISTRKEKKLFFVDHGLRNALYLKRIDEAEKSKIVENVVFVHLLTRKNKELFPKMFFWLDDNKNEIDCVVNINGEVVPVEVKYKKSLHPYDEKTIREFMARFGCKTGIIVTKDTLEKRKNVLLIPAWLFLLIV